MFRRHTNARRAAMPLLAALVFTALVDAAAAQNRLERDQVREVQQTLNDLGYEAGPEDGFYGERTAEAIRAFERERELAPTGTADRELLKRLRAAATTDPEATGAPSGPAGDGGSEEASDATAEPDTSAGTDDALSQPTRGANPTDTGAAPATQPVPTLDPVGAAENASGESGAPDTAALTNTRWRVRDETGSSFEMTFRPDGRLQGPTVNGDWRWRRRDDRLVIEFEAGPGMSTERTAPWPSESAEMTGTAESSTGRTWRWTAEKIGDTGS